MYRVPTCRVGIVFRVCAVGDNKNLNVLKQTAAGKEAVALVAVDLVERLAYGNAAAFELDMYHRQTVDEHRHVIAVVMARAFGLADLILVDDLHGVVVDVLFVDQSNVLSGAVVTSQHLNKVLLQAPGFLGDTVVGVRDTVGEKALPFAVGKDIAVEPFKLLAEVVFQFVLVMYL